MTPTPEDPLVDILRAAFIACVNDDQDPYISVEDRPSVIDGKLSHGVTVDGRIDLDILAAAVRGAAVAKGVSIANVADPAVPEPSTSVWWPEPADPKICTHSTWSPSEHGVDGTCPSCGAVGRDGLLATPEAHLLAEEDIRQGRPTYARRNEGRFVQRPITSTNPNRNNDAPFERAGTAYDRDAVAYELVGRDDADL